MASRVNMKFVIGLGICLAALAVGVVVLGVYATGRGGGEQLIAVGDKMLAEGNTDKAIKAYSKAVNKDQRNAAWIRKWITALEAHVPSNRRQYQDDYVGQYLTALRSLCDAERSNPEPYLKYNEERYQLVLRTGASLPSWERFAGEFKDNMKNFAGDQAARNKLGRFSALAASGMLASNPNLDRQKVEEGLKDAEAALSANPNDLDVVLAASQFERAISERARASGDQASSDRYFEFARARIDTFAKANAGEPRSAMELLNLDIAALARRGERITVLEALRANRGRLDGILDSIKTRDPSKTEVATVLNLAPIMQLAFPDGSERVTEMLQHVKKAKGQDPMFLLGWAQLELNRNNIAEAIKLCKEVVALKDKPLSVDGLLLHDLRVMAVKMEADALFALWERETTSEKRNEVVKQIEAARTDLATRAGEGAPQLSSIDGRLRFIQNDLSGARTLITQYNNSTNNSDANMLRIEGEILLRQQQTGAAKERFTQVLRLSPNDYRAMVSLGQIEAQASNFKEAAGHYATASALMPTNTQLADLAKNMAELAKGGAGSDPVLRTLAEADQLLRRVPPDSAAAIKLLRDALKAKPKELRLSGSLFRLLMQTGDRPAAEKILDEAIAANPNDEQLKNAKAQLQADPRATAMTNIDQADALDWQKSLARYEVLLRTPKPNETDAERTAREAEARRFLEDAVAKAPNETSVFEAEFVYWAAKADAPKLDALAQQAEKNNIDRVGGLLYRARSLIAQGRVSDANTALRDVTTRDKLNLGAWRLLGLSELELGRPVPAIDALKTAVSIKPDDLPSINGLIRAMFVSGSATEALALARKFESVAAGSPEFSEMLLVLEAQAVGGDVNRAITSRRRIAEQQPDNRANREQLASLLMNARQFEESKKIIDDLRKDKENAVAAQLEAAWRGMQGDVAGAVQLFREFIAARPKEKQTEDLYINAGRLMLQLGQPEAAVQMLKEGRAIQSPKTMMVDRELGDVQFNAGRFAEAIESYREVLKTSDDTGMPVRKRILEAMLRQKKFEDMDKEIAALGQAGQTDATVILLQAEAAVQQNDRAKAARLYDAAVAAEPKNPTNYLKRGDFKATDPKLLKDAEADYEQIIRVDPNTTIGRVRLIGLYRATGRDDLAVQMLRQTIASDPGNDNLRLALVTMFNELGRPQDAAQAADEAVASVVAIAPGSDREYFWRTRAAEQWGSISRWDKASEQFGEVWKNRPSPTVAVNYAEVLLNSGDAQGAQNLLNRSDLRVDQSVPLRMLKARIQSRRGATADAAREVAASFKMVDQADRTAVDEFMTSFRQIYSKPAEQLDGLAKLEAAGPFANFMSIRASEIRLRDTGARAAALDTVRRLAASEQADKRARIRAWALLGTQSYQLEDWSKARTEFESGLALDQNDPELNNNLAFVLASKLNLGAEALPLAQKAVTAAPNNSGFADTLGVAYLAVKDCKAAVETLNNALKLALNDVERLPVHIHLAKARLCKGERIEAIQHAERANELASKNPSLEAAYRKDLSELRTAIEQK